MKRRTLAILLTTILVALGLAAGGILLQRPSTSGLHKVPPVSSIVDLAGTDVGVETGAIFDRIIEDDLLGAAVYYGDIELAITDVRNRLISGFITDLSAARVIAQSNNDLKIIALPEEISSLPIAAFSSDRDRIDSFNRFLAELQSDGTLTQMQDRWLSDSSDLSAQMPLIPQPTTTTGTLIVAASATGVPFSYAGDDGELKGYAVELAYRYAAWAGLELQLQTVTFSDLIPDVANRRADLGLDAVSITPERAEQVIFSDPIFNDQAGVLVLSADQEAGRAG